jgi:2-methylcitrate dehydratase PrpD
MDPIMPIISYLKNAEYGDLPQDVINLIKQDFLDFCGNTLAGSNDTAIRDVCDLYMNWGGSPECSVFTYNKKLPAVHAALLNSIMAFAMDYDDTHMQGGHVGVAVFPAALAAAEIRGGVNGKEFISAVAAAMEFFVRLGIYNKRRVDRHIFGGWEYHSLHAGFSSAAVAGILLGLSKGQLLNAIGLAYHQAGGVGLSALEPSDAKTLGCGFGTCDGLASVFLAQRGITGPHSVLSGTYGFGSMYHSGCDSEGIVAGLGEKYELLDIGFKPYASCRLGHRVLDAMERLIQEHGIIASEVLDVRIMSSERVVEQLYLPPERTKAPETRNAAVFSLPWVAACMLLYGKVGVSQLSPEALNNKEIHDLAQKVFMEVDISIDPSDHAAVMPVVIRTKRGDFRTKTNPLAPGDRGYRLTPEVLKAKFFDNAANSRVPVDPEVLESIIDAALNLDLQEDIRDIIRLLG